MSCVCVLRSHSNQFQRTTSLCAAYEYMIDYFILLHGGIRRSPVEIWRFYRVAIDLRLIREQSTVLHNWPVCRGELRGSSRLDQPSLSCKRALKTPDLFQLTFGAANQPVKQLFKQ